MAKMAVELVKPQLPVTVNSCPTQVANCGRKLRSFSLNCDSCSRNWRVLPQVPTVTVCSAHAGQTFLQHHIKNFRWSFAVFFAGGEPTATGNAGNEAAAALGRAQKKQREDSYPRSGIACQGAPLVSGGVSQDTSQSGALRQSGLRWRILLACSLRVPFEGGETSTVHVCGISKKCPSK